MRSCGVCLMADKIKYVIELMEDGPTSLYVSLYQHLTRKDGETLVELITSEWSPNISDGLWWAGHEIADFMGQEWL